MTHYLEHTRSVQDILSERNRQRSEGRYVPENLDWIGRNILPTGDISYRVEQRELDAPIPGWVPMGDDPYARDLGKILPLGIGGRNRPTTTFPGEYRESNILVGRVTGRRETGPFTDTAEPGQVEIHEFLHDAERVLRDNPAYWSDVTWLNPDTGKRENLQQLLIHGLGPKRPHTDLSWRRPTFHDAVFWSTDWEGNIKEGSADRAEAILRSLDVAASNIKNAWESGSLDQTNYGASRIPGMEVSAGQAEMPIDPRAQPYKPGFWAVDYDPTQARWQETESELGGYGVDVRAQPEKIGGTGYQQWDVGADYVPGISSVMPDITSRMLNLPPGPPGEAAFRQSQAVPSTLQAGNGLISQPVTTGLIEQPTGAAQSTFDYGRALLEEELQRSIRREETEPPYDPAAELQGLLRAEQTEPTFQQIEPGYQPRVIPGHVPFQDLPQGGVWPEPPANGGFLSKAGGMLGKGLVSMISKAKADVQDQGLLAEKDRKAEIAEQKLEAKRKSKVELYQASILKKPESKYLINEGVNNLKIINSWGKRTNFEKGLVSVGEYNLDTDTKKQLTTSKLPWYANRAYLTSDAAEEFELMRDAYGKDIPLESAYRNKDHNDALAILYGEAVKSSKHMDGLSIDVPSGAARDWMLLNGEKYGWELAVYKKKDGTMNKNHFNFVGGGP